MVSARTHYRPDPGFRRRGLLFALEGPDGCGKTTISRSVADALRADGQQVVCTNWNETTALYNLTARLTAAGQVDGRTRLLLGAAELAARWHYVIGPALHRGSVVLATKYLLAPFGHAAVRGQDLDLITEAYSFAPLPDLTIYLDVAPRTGLERKLADGKIGYWEAGLDMRYRGDVAQSMAAFRQGRIGLQEISASFLDFQQRLRETEKAQLSMLPAAASISAEGPLDVVMSRVLDALGTLLDTFAGGPRPGQSP